MMVRIARGIGVSLMLSGLVSLAAACGGTQSGDGVNSQTLTDQPPVTYEEAPTEEGGDTAATTPPGTAHVEFGEIAIFQGPDAKLKVHGDGTSEIVGEGGAWEAGPKLRNDGLIVYKQQEVAQLKEDGTIVNLMSKKTLPVTFSGDQLVAQGMGEGGADLVFTQGADGSITVPGQDGKPAQVMRSEGATTEGQRRLVLGLIGALFIGGGQ